MPSSVRAADAPPLATVVLHEPEIPNNTGTIGRTCVAMGAALRLIEPIGFDVSAKACRRAGLDYWPRLDFGVEPSFAAYASHPRAATAWALSTRATRPVFEADFAAGDHIVFGSESRGLPADVLGSFGGRALCLPMLPGERSLNLANAVSMVLGEMVRQFAVSGAVRMEHGRISRAEDDRSAAHT
ncbi:MAG: tRNA (cytidine(34)-2'-O)-methyltransferase [Planctomycetota bacterium]